MAIKFKCTDTFFEYDQQFQEFESEPTEDIDTVITITLESYVAYGVITVSVKWCEEFSNWDIFNSFKTVLESNGFEEVSIYDTEIKNGSYRVLSGVTFGCPSDLENAMDDIVKYLNSKGVA